MNGVEAPMLAEAVVSAHTSPASYYAAADLYAHPARADTFPNVVLEALACGRPVVATAVAEISEQVHDLDHDPLPTGKLVPPGDAAALATAIARLLHEPETRRRLEVKAAADARQGFDLRGQEPAYRAVYEQAIARWRDEQSTGPLPA